MKLIQSTCNLLSLFASVDGFDCYLTPCSRFFHSYRVCGGGGGGRGSTRMTRPKPYYPKTTRGIVNGCLSCQNVC